MMQEVADWFEKHDDQFLKFERILITDRRHPRPDVCAFMYIHEKCGGEGDVVDHAEHDQIWLDADVSKLAEEDVIYLLRCGILYDDNQESLYSYV